jgi:hypothetical protein
MNQRGSDEVMLYLNTADAGFTSQGDYCFTLLRTLDHVKAIQLMQHNLNWSFPNVRTSTNTLIFSEADTNTVMRTITLPVGQYSDEDIAVDLASAMTTASGGTPQTYTISVNYVTEQFTITGSAKNFTIYYAGTTLAPLIGLTADITSTSNALTFQTPMDLLPTTEIQIRLPNLIQNYETSRTNLNQDLLAVCSLSGYQYGDMIRENNASVISATIVSQIHQLTLSLVDDTGYSPDWNPAIPMSFVLRVELW